MKNSTPRLDYILTVEEQLSSYSAFKFFSINLCLEFIFVVFLESVWYTIGVQQHFFSFLEHVAKKFFYYTMKIFLISRIFQIKNSVTTKKCMKLKSSYNRYKIHNHTCFFSGWQTILLEVEVLIFVNLFNEITVYFTWNSLSNKNK